MAQYRILLKIGQLWINVPVLPDHVAVKTPGTNERVTVLELGEVNRLKKAGLREISWESFFPANAAAPYVTSPSEGAVQPLPIEAVRLIQAQRNAAKPVRLKLLGFDLDINMQISIESFDYEERGGEPGDLYYEIKLVEWRDYSPRRLKLKKDKDEADEEEKKRPGEPDKPKTHKVKKGDTLWAIARKYLGKGGRWPEIYNANKSKIKNPDLIYAGQVFKIP